jgi:hypothetical protein
MKKILMTAAAVAAMGLSACAAYPTPYQPVGLRGAPASGGFSELQLESNRFRVNFAGNSYTRRETVENYLLLRAAELTLSQGYDWFTTVERDTERRTRYRDYGFGGSRFGGPFGYGYPGYYGRGYGYGYGFSPSWRYYGRAGWSPFYDPFGWDREVDIREINRYEATAEIVMGRGPKPPADPRAFDAREVQRSLGAYVTRPI